MSDSKQKVYVPSTFGNVKTFDNGGELINIDFTDAEGLKKFIDENSVANKFRIVVQKQLNDPSKASVTLNTYQPKAKEESSDDSGDLPF